MADSIKPKLNEENEINNMFLDFFHNQKKPITNDRIFTPRNNQTLYPNQDFYQYR